MGAGMNGLETYKQALELQPGIKAIIISGYYDSDKIDEALKLGAGDFIKKPYTINQIAKAIKKELLSDK